MSLRSYIEERSIPVPFAGCWLWLLSCGSHGYGQAYLSKSCRVTTAHRVAYEAFRGSIPPGMLVQHKCDQRWCVNPDHLELGTDKTNCDDKVRKGRDGREKKIGCVAVNRALTLAEASTIRVSHGTQRDIAARFGTNQRTVNLIRQGLIYKDAPEVVAAEYLTVGDRVSWSAQGHGKGFVELVGTIVEVVISGSFPMHTPTSHHGVFPRNHVSYVAAIPQFGSVGQEIKPRYYWPRAGTLQNTKGMDA